MEALHVTTTVLITYAMTHHTKYDPPTEVPQFISETTADPDHILHINQVRKLHLHTHPALAGQQ